MPPTIPPPKRGTRSSPYATWSHFCPLGRQFDQVDSDHEDHVDAVFSLQGVAP